jgi:hypothetical protein
MVPITADQVVNYLVVVSPVQMNAILTVPPGPRTAEVGADVVAPDGVEGCIPEGYTPLVAAEQVALAQRGPAPTLRSPPTMLLRAALQKAIPA